MRNVCTAISILIFSVATASAAEQAGSPANTGAPTEKADAAREAITAKCKDEAYKYAPQGSTRREYISNYISTCIKKEFEAANK